jgi:glutamate-5-semialdehyde dehydrogenase
LRGGKEARKTNILLTEIVQKSLKEAGLPAEAVLDIHRSDRSQVMELLKLDEDIDLIIPRGGKQLHRFCAENSMIPIVSGGIGICHLYVDAEVNVEKALAVVENAKVQRPTVCNALDTVLVHTDIAAQFIPLCVQKLGHRHVNFRVDPGAMSLLSSIDPALKEQISPAGEEDWDTEWLSLILGIKVVDSFSDAVAHICKHSSGHSDGILTTNMKTGEEFVRVVDSAAVYINASTRFTDGSCFGLGAEVAVSTQKFHARGPMGLRELTSYKWVVRGDNHVRKPRE